MIIIIWREDIWAMLWMMKSILLGGKGVGGADIPRSEINIKIDFPGQEEKYLFCEKFPFLAWLLAKASQEFHMGNGIWNSTFHSEIQEI